jgi:hypothetical protein
VELRKGASTTLTNEALALTYQRRKTHFNRAYEVLL